MKWLRVTLALGVAFLALCWALLAAYGLAEGYPHPLAEKAFGACLDPLKAYYGYSPKEGGPQKVAFRVCVFAWRSDQWSSSLAYLTYW